MGAPAAVRPRGMAALRPGATVLLAGLKAAPHLNGTAATCESWDSEVCRWRVRLESGEVKGVKEENLEVTEDRPGQALPVSPSPADPPAAAAPEVAPPQPAIKIEAREDEAEAAPASELRLSGTRCLDAADYESFVIGRCDTVAALQRARLELAHAEREAERLERRCREAEAQRRRPGNGSAERSAEEQQKQKLQQQRLEEASQRARSELQRRRDEVQRLERLQQEQEEANPLLHADEAMAAAGLLQEAEDPDSDPEMDPPDTQRTTTVDLVGAVGDDECLGATTGGSASSTAAPLVHSEGGAQEQLQVKAIRIKEPKTEPPPSPARKRSRWRANSVYSPASTATLLPTMSQETLAGDSRASGSLSAKEYLSRFQPKPKRADAASRAAAAPGAAPKREVPKKEERSPSPKRRRGLAQPVRRGSSSSIVTGAREYDEKFEPKTKVKPEEELQGDEVLVEQGLRCPRWLWEALYPYQHNCVRWLWNLHCEGLGGILADEMGLGKTIQVIAFLAVLHHSGILQNITVQNFSMGRASAPTTGAVLILCPATLISQWRNELQLWYPPLSAHVLHQVEEKRRREVVQAACSEHGVLITSYETMRLEQELMVEASWTVVILDEGQKIRNPHANVTMAVKQLSTAHRYILSGSPIQNNLQELWSLFDFVCPGRLGTLPVFLEEFSHPIEAGNLVGASEAKVAAAYECALALRELTMPCILRRTKAEVMDVLKLPHKQEQVLFCHLSPVQYQVYIDFLQSEHVRRAKCLSEDRRSFGAVLFSIGVLRKLCNHPDLLLRQAEPELRPPDMWNYQRSGKMKVLAEMLQIWQQQTHRALIFVQTVQMLEVIQGWMNEKGYRHLRIDGQTPVRSRLRMIEEFNGNTDIFAMVLTTRVGGVGLNIVGADRVVIFDPDWNPMTDVQARERAWRIGQRRDVAIYRLVVTGTVEEKIYHRQVYKHFLSQKVLCDPRQRQFFKWNDLADLFDVPPAPPDFKLEDMQMLRSKYKDLFRKIGPQEDEDSDGGEQVETLAIMKAISSLPAKEENLTSRETSDEHNTIVQTLFDSNGIKASFNHDKVEQPLLDRNIVRETASQIATQAVQVLKRSSRECSEHPIHEPTWTGQRGMAGAKSDLKGESKVKRESGAGGGGGGRGAQVLGKLRSRLLSPDVPPEIPLQDDKKIAEAILQVFRDPKLAGARRRLTTGDVLRHLAGRVANHHSDLFKSLLHQLCDFAKPILPDEPGVWTLRPEFWPEAGG